MRAMRLSSCQASNTMLTDTPLSSRCSGTVRTACMQASSRARKYVSSWVSGVTSSAAPAVRSPGCRCRCVASQALASWRKGVTTSCTTSPVARMRRRRSGEKAAERTWLTLKVMASAISARQCAAMSSTGGAAPATSSASTGTAGVVNKATTRASCASGRAISQSASSALLNKSPNKEARSPVSGVAGMILVRSRSANSDQNAGREVKPKSASSEVASLSSTKRCRTAATARRRPGSASSASSTACRRQTAAGKPGCSAGAGPPSSTGCGPARSHCTSAMSQRWRSGRAARGSACCSKNVSWSRALVPGVGAMRV